MQTKYVLNSLLLAASMGIANASSADCTRFYVGGELGYNKFNYTSEFKQDLKDDNATAKSKVPTAGLLAGAKLGNFGVELGYTFFKKVKITDPNGNDHIKFRNIYADLLGYVPMDQINFIASVGVGRIKGKDSTGGRSKKTSFRLGAGAQYDFNQHAGVRAMLRYQKGGKKILVKSAVSANLAAIYAF